MSSTKDTARIPAASPLDLSPLRKALAALSETRGMLIPLLQETQRIYGYVPEEAADLIADAMGIYRSQVYGVLTFYAQFHLTPRGRHIIRACCGTACHVRGGSRVIDRLEKVLGVGHGQTTADMAFSFEKVACLGACGLAPVVMIDEDAFGAMDPAKMETLVREKKKAMRRPEGGNAAAAAGKTTGAAAGETAEPPASEENG